MRLYIVSICLTALLSGCNGIFDPCTEGNGNIITTQLQVNSFQSITHEGTWDIRIIYDTAQSVSVTGDANIIDRIERDVDENEWDIELRDGCYRSYQLEMEIRTPFLNDINLDGSGDISVRDLSIVQYRNSGSGDILIESIGSPLTKIYLNSIGSGDFVATSAFEVPEININSSGSGDLELFQIMSDSSFITLSGSGDVKVTVDELLDCTISGSGDILYKGFPVINEDITGSGRLIDAN